MNRREAIVCSLGGLAAFAFGKLKTPKKNRIFWATKDWKTKEYYSPFSVDMGKAISIKGENLTGEM